MSKDLIRALAGCCGYLALLGTVASCAPDGHRGPDPARSSVAALPSGSNSPSAVPAAPDRRAVVAPSGPAVAKYGQAAMTSAYRAMLAFSFDNGWNPRLITTHVDAIRPADFTAMLAAMTPRCAAAFKAAIGKAGHHDKAAVRALQGAVFFGVTGPNGIRPVGTIGLVSSRSFSLATLGLDTGGGTDRVSISFTAKANIHLQDRRGKQYLLPTSRAVRFLLVAGGKDSSTPFLIDAWRNTMTVGKVAPV